MSHSISELPIPLTPAGRPVLQTGEVEIKTEGDVTLYHVDGKAVLLHSCVVTLTNYRLIFINGECAVGLDLASVHRIEDLTSIFRHSKRFRIYQSGDSKLELKFSEGGKEAFYSHMESALSRKSWERKPQSVTSAAFSGQSAGIGGLLRRREKERSTTDSMAEAALSDLDSLMKNAREIVTVVEKFSHIMTEAQSAEGMSETSSEIGERNEMENILQNIGIISPVTKLSAGRLYHQQLAQQIADMLHGKKTLSRMGGMATITDIYCLYNRARGTELVSPDDFYQAVLLFDKMPFLQLRLREFDSGVRVIADAGLNMRNIFERIAELAKESPIEGISVSEIAAVFHVSIMVAMEQVNLAEQECLIVRDDSFSGMQYFENRFDNFVVSS